MRDEHDRTEGAPSSAADHHPDDPRSTDRDVPADDGRRDPAEPDGDILGGLGRADAEDPRPRRRTRRALVVALVSLLVLVVGAGAAALLVSNRLDGNIERFADPFEDLPTRPPLPQGIESDTPVEERPMNVLVLGSDSRISAGDPDQWEAGAQRTDVIMLVHLAADRSSAQVMSFPRDLWVPIPGHGHAKINAAFSYGGPTLLIQTVEQLTDVRIDHLALTDFRSFEDLTDAMGGVDLTLQQDLVDRGRLVAEAGEQRLSGKEALVYVRQRKNLPRGDFDRVQRQQAWMRAIMHRLTDDDVLRDPTKWYPLLSTATKSVSVDEGFTRDAMTGLLGTVRDLRPGDVDFLTVPHSGTGTSADGQSIVVLDEPGMDALMDAVRDDRAAEFLEDGAENVERLPTVAP